MVSKISMVCHNGANALVGKMDTKQVLYNDYKNHKQSAAQQKFRRLRKHTTE